MPTFRARFDSFANRRIPKIPTVDCSLNHKLALVRRHGDFSVAFSTAVQPSLSHFGDEEGYIAFGTKMGRVFALGDPVAPAARKATLIEQFVAAANRPTFVQVSSEIAKILSSLGYRINIMGVDTRLALPAHDFAGKHSETIRYSERWLFKKGYSIVEDLGKARQVSELSASWLSERIISHREMAFLNRPFSFEPFPGMRRFLLVDPIGALEALLDFDPLYRDGAAIGYSSTFKRKRAGATSHAEIGLTKFAVDRFRSEGLLLVTLGLSPLAGIGPSGFRESRLLRALSRQAFGSGLINRRIFNLRGQAAFKRRFHGVEEPTYIACSNTSLLDLIGLLRLCKAI